MRKLISLAAAVVIAVGCLVPAWAAEPDETRVYDYAELFTDAEEAELEEQIDSFRTTYQADAVVLTEEDGSVTDPELRAQDFYDEGGFGLGSNRSGVILYINMATRDVSACASGETKYVLLSTDLDRVIDAGYAELADGEYAGSLESMLRRAGEILEQSEETGTYQSGSYTGRHTAPDDRSIQLRRDLPMILVVSACGGGICAVLVYVLVSRRYANPVHSAVYNARGNTTMNLTEKQDLFVNKTVTMRRIQHDPPRSSGGHSSSFRSSSSGRSFSSSSRKF